MSIPRTTHQWLKPIYDVLEGKGSRMLQLGSPTGIIGMYGATAPGKQLATGTAGITGVTGAGGATGPSVWWFNGGTGSFYTISDVVLALKNCAILKP